MIPNQVRRQVIEDAVTAATLHVQLEHPIADGRQRQDGVKTVNSRDVEATDSFRELISAVSGRKRGIGSRKRGRSRGWPRKGEIWPKPGIRERPVSDIEKLRAAYALGFAVNETLPRRGVAV